MKYIQVYIGKIVTQLYQLDRVTKRDIKKAFKNTYYYVDIEDKVLNQYETYLIENNIESEIDDKFIEYCVKYSYLTQRNIKKVLYKVTHKTLLEALNERVSVDDELIQRKYQDIYQIVLNKISQDAQNSVNKLSKELLI